MHKCILSIRQFSALTFSSSHFASPFSHLAVDPKMDQKQVIKIKNIFSLPCDREDCGKCAEFRRNPTGLRVSRSLGILEELGRSQSDGGALHPSGGGFPDNPDGKKEATFFCFPHLSGRTFWVNEAGLCSPLFAYFLCNWASSYKMKNRRGFTYYSFLFIPSEHPKYPKFKEILITFKCLLLLMMWSIKLTPHYHT